MEPITFDQKTLTLSQWATLVDVPYRTLHRRYTDGLRPPELFAPTNYHRPSRRDISHTLVTLGTKTQTLRKWASERQLPYATLKQRYLRGKRGAELLKTRHQPPTPNPKTAVLTFLGKTQSLYNWALKFNISWVVTYKRYMDGMRDPYDLLHTEQNEALLAAITDTTNATYNT